MPDLQRFRLTARPDSSLTVAVIRCEAQVTDSRTGAVIADYTGANSIDFALRVPGFTAAEHKLLAERIADWIIKHKAGVE